MTAAPSDLAAARRVVLGALARNLCPPPSVSVDEWAERARFLDRRASAEPGPWRNSRVPYLVEPMRCLTDPGVRSVVLMWASQTAKTECGLNWLGRTVECDPGPFLWVTSTEASMTKVSRRRIDPLLDSPSLRGLVSEKKSRDSDRTTSSVGFQGGYLGIVSANSPSALSSDPIKFLVLDEVDRYLLSSKDEGDPISLALARQTSFEQAGAKTLALSSPGIAGASRIEALFEEGDCRYYEVPCPACGTMQRLVWAQVKFPDGPEGARYECESCSAAWDDGQRWRAVARGRWVATKPGGKVASFHLSQLYSCFVRLETLADRWLKAQGKPELLQAFCNTVLAETWSVDGERVDATAIPQEQWPEGSDFPTSVVLLVSFTDVQHDRLETTVLGLSPDESFYPVTHEVYFGPTAQPSAPVWQQLDDFLRRTWRRGDGREFRIAAAGVDAGDQMDVVLDFCNSRRGIRVWGMKGFSRGIGSPIVAQRKASQTNAGKRFWAHNVDAAKHTVLQRLKIEDGPGRFHFPAKPCFSATYFAQLTCERLERRHVRGFPKVQWRKADSARNEAIDCMAGCVSVVRWLNPALDVLGAKLPPLQDPAAPRDPDAAAGEVDPTAVRPGRQEPRAAPRPARRRIVKAHGRGGAWFDRT